MNSSPNRYCLLKKSFNCALKIKRIPIPFLIGKDSQTDFTTVIDLERSSIPLYVTRKRPYQIPPLRGNTSFLTPIFKDRRVALTIPLLFENSFWRIRANATQPRTRLCTRLRCVNRSFDKSLLPVVCASRSCVSALAFQNDFAINVSSNSSRWLSTRAAPQLSYSTSYTRLRLPFQYTKVKTCSLQLDSLAQLDKLDYSCSSKNTKKKNCIIVRPLLDLSRGVIAAICKYGKFPVYPDRSNQSLHYSRNRIRKQIIPSIQLFFNPQAEDALFQFTELVLQEQDLVSRVIHTAKR